ncbi:MAG TPA: type II toxin-antitoxin system VapB family antitoxin [Acidobacteriaceae bacterium]|jgi:antitoxin VapB|nr:type II toxin-antitoxin system VapB family antitoxin [Acidobacteriaceae bacterium]
MYMALHIQDPETDQLARQLSAATGETITQAIKTALRERLDTIAPPVNEEEYIARIEKISDWLTNLPVLDSRTPDEIIGYNEHGHFD